MFEWVKFIALPETGIDAELPPRLHSPVSIRDLNQALTRAVVPSTQIQLYVHPQISLAVTALDANGDRWAVVTW